MSLTQVSHPSCPIKTIHVNYYKNKATFYVVNFEESGFVIVSADDRVNPILGYSLKNSLPRKLKNPAVKYWLDRYSKEIKHIISKKTDNTQTLKKWNDIINNKFVKGTKAVAPMLSTAWDQGSGYNTYVPGSTPVGCVATAMAQIMNYHEYPATGISWHRYVHPTYGEQIVHFNEGDYNWSNMPNTSGNDDVAKLMYHCGVAVDMDYQIAGSGAQSSDVPYVMANYFKYDQGIKYLSRSWYPNNNEWIDLLKTELDASRPLYYSGSSEDDGGHAFVFDGYNDNNQFHVNWGWSGAANGYFTVDALSPNGSDFSEEGGAVIGIQPPGTEDFLFVKKYTDFPNASTFPAYIDGVDNLTAWVIGRDGSGDANEYHVCSRTVDGGSTWKAYEPEEFSAYQFSMVSGVSGNVAYIPIFGTGTALIKTTDGGKTWSNILEGTSNTSFFNVVHFFNENDGIVQGDPQNGEFELWVTSNAGANWSQINGADIPDPISDDEMGTTGFYTAVGNTIWYTTNKGRIFKSTDKGLNWTVHTVFSGSGKNIGVTTAFNDAATRGIAIVSVSDASDNVTHSYYSSDDGGETWTEYTPTGNFYTAGVSSVPGTANKFVSVGSDYETPLMGVSYSTDGGVSWTEYAEYYKGNQMNGVDFVSDDKGYIGTFSGKGSGGMFVSGELWWELDADYSYIDSGDNDTLFCSSSGVEFTNESTGFIDSYSWNFGDGATPATATGIGPHTVTYSTDGNKTVTLIVVDKYGNTTSSKNIIISDATPIEITEITGEEVVATDAIETYSVPAQDNTFFNWAISVDEWAGESNTNNIDITFTGDGATGTIDVYAYNGCGESSVRSLSVISGYSVNITPNPAYNEITIPETENSTINIYDINGKLVHSEYTTKRLQIVDVSSLSGGIYFVSVNGTSGEKKHKIAIVR